MQQAEAVAQQREQLRAQHQLALNVQATTFIATINQMGDLCNSWFTHVQGFNDNNLRGDLMLAVSELAEACEGDRKPHKDPHCPEFDNREVEVADALVRILQIGHKYGLRVGPAFIAKMGFNLGRPFKHGKEY